MNAKEFSVFESEALAAGFDEALERRWEPDALIELHSHPFDAKAVVVQGEMWLSCQGETRHLVPGDMFALACGEPHAERYGAEGATYWVARRKPDSRRHDQLKRSTRYRSELYG